LIITGLRKYPGLIKKKLKRLFSIALLFFLLANLAGFYVYFYFRLIEIRSEMRAALKNSPEKLQAISLSLTEYQKAKEGDDEIKWRGEMYDVAFTELQGERITIFGLRDEAETNLLAFLKSVVNTASQDHQSPPTSLIQFSSLVFTLPHNSPITSIIAPSRHTHFTLYLFGCYQTYDEISSPPPQS
jgi:hypothetical protein